MLVLINASFSMLQYLHCPVVGVDMTLCIFITFNLSADSRWMTAKRVGYLLLSFTVAQ
jgi:hypothetical protein